ncbi:ABC transporter permease [Corynebacterium uterequi]|uniref:ABC-2 type transporter transmembrane domain-containing protein n=1 Tax=Corynebacterium uterequi TaxID=1072256 RepID=A0A0G3HCD8_9CORY|nr:ABC transporter permease [Corynebacterium uterequi]AKK10964.1 hypothetical protein CUTER_04795 [Corynebacterium uterequi]
MTTPTPALTAERSAFRRTLAYCGYCQRRILSDYGTLFFSIGLPVLFYFFISAANDGTDLELPGGNLAAYLMVGMALYGGVTSVVSGGALEVVDRLTGWGRQLALTPLSASQILITEVVSAAHRVILPITAVFLAGAATGVEMPARHWAVTYLICCVCSVPFGFLGMAASALAPRPSTVGVVSSSVAFLAFAGNLFVPIPDSWLSLARLTPLWGPSLLARHPILQDMPVLHDSEPTSRSDLTAAVISTIVWAVIFIAAFVLLSRREKARA